MRRAAASVVLLALLTGCAQSVDPIERLGRKAAEKMSPDCRRPLGTAPAAGQPLGERSPGAATPSAEPSPDGKRCPRQGGSPVPRAESR
ncbi:hypothetical protein GCM10010252_08040 [Streptomyces aureoverticillatus]|nr:hypothetical protein GCM10010252_08040 [Streptomyces aureoverticillatus]